MGDFGESYADYDKTDLVIPSGDPYDNLNDDEDDRVLYNSGGSSVVGFVDIDLDEARARATYPRPGNLKAGLLKRKSSRLPLNIAQKDRFYAARKRGGGARAEQIPSPRPPRRNLAATKIGGEASLLPDSATCEKSSLSELLAETESLAAELSGSDPSPTPTNNSTATENDVKHLTGALAQTTFIGDLNAAEKELRALRRLSIDSEAHATLASSGAIAAAIEAMARFPSGNPIQELGLLFLGDVSRSAIANKVEVVRRGGVEVLHRILRDNRDPKLLARACVTLRAAVERCEYNAVRVGVRGGPSVVLRAMRRHPHDERLQADGWCTLAVLAEGAIENVAQLRDVGAGAEGVSALQQFASRADVVAPTLRVIAALLQANAPVIPGQPAAVAAALVRFAASRRDVVAAAAQCARQIASLVAHTTDCSPRQDGLPATVVSDLARAAARWQRFARTVRTVLAALADVTVGRDDAKAAAGAVAGPIMEALARRVADSDADGTALGLRVLRNISARAGPARVLARGGTAMNAVAALRRFQDDAGVQEQGCAVLVNLLGVHGGGGVRGADGLSAHLSAVRGRHGGTVAGTHIEYVSMALGMGGETGSCGITVGRIMAGICADNDDESDGGSVGDGHDTE